MNAHPRPGQRVTAFEFQRHRGRQQRSIPLGSSGGLRHPAVGRRHCEEIVHVFVQRQRAHEECCPAGVARLHWARWSQDRFEGSEISFSSFCPS